MDITNLSLSPTTIVGGSTQESTGTVTIAPVNTVTTVVYLSGSAGLQFLVNGSPASSIWIAAGQTQGSFTIRAGVVSATTNSNVRATVTSYRDATLTVTPILQSLSVSPSSIIGGSNQDATGTIGLAAPTRDLLGVSLSHSPVAYLVFSTVPNGASVYTIYISAGQSSGVFYIRGNSVLSTAINTNVSATVGTNAQQAPLTVNPFAVTVSLAPNSLFGGSSESSTGTVSLNAPTRGGAMVTMSKAPSVPVLPNFPSYVFISAGQANGTFAFQAGPTSTTAVVTITASYGTSGSAPVTIYPANPDLGTCKDCNAGAGKPINLTNGNTWVQHRDYSLPGLGGGIELVRTWNSLWQSSSPIEMSGMFGHSWRSTYEERLVSGSPLKYWRADGSVWQFQYDSISQTYALVAPTDERAVVVFDSGTTLYTLTFADGSKKIFNNSGYLTKIIDRNGNQTTVTYDGTNRITQVTDAAARSITFTYPSGSVRQVQRVQDAVGIFATYTYDGSLRLTQVTYADNSFMTFTYDVYHRLLNVKDTSAKILEAHTYDGSHRGLTSESANAAEKVTVTYTSATATRVTDSQAHTTDYTHQPIGARRWITQIAGPGCVTCGGRGNSSFTYDFKGRRVTSTDALGRTTTYAYDIFSNLTSRSVQLNPQTTLSWSYTYNSLGQVLTATDPAGNVTTNTYDAVGNLLSTTTPSPDGVLPGSTTSFTYDALGQPTRVTDPRVNQTNITYTAAGLIATVTDAQNHVTTYAYDARGNRTSVTDPLNNTSTFTYNNMNRLTQIAQPGNVVTTFAYDNRGRRTSVTDANSKVTSYAYDDADRLTSATDAASQVTGYIYDTESNLTRITDALGRQTNFAYDAYGRVTTVTFPSTLTETYAYDLLGNLTSKTDRKGQAITYAYDALNRLTRKQYPDSSGVDYTYDNLSRLTRVADATGTYDFAYDNLGRLMQTTTAYAFLTSRNFVVSYGYDAASNRTAMTDPEGGSSSYAYDTLNRLTTLTPPSAISGAFTFSYDVLSRRTQLARPNGVSTNYSYDSFSRLLSVLHQSGGNTIDGTGYTVDNVGNRTAKTDLPASTTSSFSYDAIYQLTQVVQGLNTSETYSYDAVGNRLSSLGVSPYTYNTSNQLASIAGTPPTSFTYDNNGNTLTKTDASGTTSYAWDFENRLTSVTLPDSSVVSFKYDDLGRRIRKSSTSGTTIYIYDSHDIIEETDAAGLPLARYAQGEVIDEPLSVARGGATYLYSADGLGSITSLTDATGAVAASYLYDSFGKQTSSTGSVTNSFRYVARELDSETALYFYRARYYDPALGRFLNEDPVGFVGGVNFYGYVGNSPISFVDPLGLEAWPVTSKWTPEKIKAYAQFMESFVQSYQAPIDCADLALLGLINFSSQNGLPVKLKYFSGKKVKSFDSRSDEFTSMGQFRTTVLRNMGALNVIDNTHPIKASELQAGDLLMSKWDSQIGHTRVVTGIGCRDCTDPTVIWYQGNLPPQVPYKRSSPLSGVPGGMLAVGQIPRRWNFGAW